MGIIQPHGAYLGCAANEPGPLTPPAPESTVLALDNPGKSADLPLPTAGPEYLHSKLHIEYGKRPRACFGFRLPTGNPFVVPPAHFVAADLGAGNDV